MHRPFLRTIAALAGVAAPLLLASPAAADPSDGQGCAGLQSTPAAYVCLIALNPAAVPGVNQTGTTTLFDDNVCYLAGCRRVTVTVPTFGLQMPTAPVLVVYYNGKYHSVGLTSLTSAQVDRWADCTVESTTDDRVDIDSSGWYSGYTALSCTGSYLL